jgi:hypothetical protein
MLTGGGPVASRNRLSLRAAFNTRPPCRLTLYL